MATVTGYTAEKSQELFPAVVDHGSNADAPRPEEFNMVIWRGSVEPNNKLPGDLVITVP